MDSHTTEPGDHRTPRHRQIAHPDRARVAAIHAGHKVRYFTAADLVETLYRGLADNTVGKIIESLLRVDLIILDELGFAPLDDTGTQLLFRLVAGAYERRSLAIGSHWPFEQWGRFLPEQTTAVSILDRLLHHATVVITDGESYRMKDAQHREATHDHLEHPHGVGTFIWPPAGTSTWPLTVGRTHTARMRPRTAPARQPRRSRPTLIPSGESGAPGP